MYRQTHVRPSIVILKGMHMDSKCEWIFCRDCNGSPLWYSKFPEQSSFVLQVSTARHRVEVSHTEALVSNLLVLITSSYFDGGGGGALSRVTCLVKSGFITQCSLLLQTPHIYLWSQDTSLLGHLRTPHLTGHSMSPMSSIHMTSIS